MLDTIKGWFQAVIDKVAAVVKWFADLFLAVFKAILLLLQDVFCWILEGLFKVIQTLLDNLPGDMSAFNPGSYISGLPADLVNMLGVLRVGEALAIILSAILIKIALQLIPFTRLGS